MERVEQTIGYGDMPAPIRLMIAFLGVVAVSEFFRAVALGIVADHHGPNVPFSLSLAGALMFGVVWSLKRKTNRAPWRAAQLIAMGILSNGYAIYTMRALFDAFPGVSFVWPFIHILFYLVFIWILLTPETAEFYRAPANNAINADA